MPNKKNAIKELRKSRKLAAINRARKDSVKSLVKHARHTLDENATNAKEAVDAAVKALDRAAQSKLMKKNTVSRKKSRLMKRLKGTTPAAHSKEKTPA